MTNQRVGQCGLLYQNPRLCVLHNRLWFLTVLEVRSLRSGCQCGWVLCEWPLPGLQTIIFAFKLNVVESKEREEASYLLSLLLEVLVQSRGLHPYGLIMPQGLQLQVPSDCRLWFKHRNLKGWVDSNTVHSRKWHHPRIKDVQEPSIYDTRVTSRDQILNHSSLKFLSGAFQ